MRCKYYAYTDTHIQELCHIVIQVYLGYILKAANSKGYTANENAIHQYMPSFCDQCLVVDTFQVFLLSQ